MSWSKIDKSTIRKSTLKINKQGKLICNLNDKNYDVHVRTLKQALNHELNPEKIHRAIKFNQKEWLLTYIDLNTELQRNAKNNFEKIFDNLMNNSVFGKTMENVQKSRNIELVNNDLRKKYLVSEPKFY